MKCLVYLLAKASGTLSTEGLETDWTTQKFARRCFLFCTGGSYLVQPFRRFHLGFRLIFKSVTIESNNKRMRQEFQILASNHSSRDSDNAKRRTGRKSFTYRINFFRIRGECRLHSSSCRISFPKLACDRSLQASYSREPQRLRLERIRNCGKLVRPMTRIKSRARQPWHRNHHLCTHYCRRHANPPATRMSLNSQFYPTSYTQSLALPLHLISQNTQGSKHRTLQAFI